MKKIALYLWLTAIGVSGLTAEGLVYKNKATVLTLVGGEHFYDWNRLDEVYQKDREVVLKAINAGNCVIDELYDSFQKDKEIVKLSLQKSGCGIKYADEDMMNDRELLVDAVVADDTVYKKLPKNLKEDRDFVFSILKKKISFFYDLPIHLKKDKKILKLALKSGYGLQFANKNITANREIMREYIEKNPYTLEYADISLRSDRKFIYSLMRGDSCYGFEYADASLRSDKKFVSSLIKKCSCSSILYDVNSSLLNDKEFMLPLIQQDSDSCLSFAGKKLKDEPWVNSLQEKEYHYPSKEKIKEITKNKESILKALKYEKYIGFIDKKLLKDRELVLAYLDASDRRSYDWEDVNELIPQSSFNDKSFILELSKVFPQSFSYLDKKFKKDKDVVWAYIIHSHWNLKEIDEVFLKDESFIAKVINLTGYGIEYATAEQQDNRTLVLSAVEKNYENFKYASKRLKNDKTLLQKNMDILKYMGDSVMQDKKFILELIERVEDFDSYKWKYIANIFKRDRDIIFAYAKKNRYLIDELDEVLQQDKEFVTNYIKTIGYGLKYATTEQQDNRTFVLSILINGFRDFKYVSQRLKSNKGFILEIIEQNKYIDNGFWRYLDNNLKKDKEIIFAYANYNGTKLIDELDIELQEDKKFVSEYLNRLKYGLEYATVEQQDNRTLVLSIIDNHFREIIYASDRLKNDKSILKKEPLLFKYMGDSVKDDKESVLFACKYDILPYISNRLKKDKSFMLQFIEKLGYLPFDNWEYIDKSLQKDREIIFAYAKTANNHDVIDELDRELQEDNNFVLEYIKKTGYGFKYATKEQQNDETLILSALNKSLDALEYADKNITTSRDFILKAVTRNGYLLDSVAKEFNDDKEIILGAVTQNGSVIEYASKRLQRDEEIIIASTKQDGSGWKYASDRLKRDRDFLLASLKHDDEIWDDMNKTLKNDREFILASLQSSDERWDDMNETQKNDREFILASLQSSDERWKDVNDTLRKDKDFMLKAIESYASEFQFADESLRKDKEFILEAIKVNRYVSKYLDDNATTVSK